MLSSQRAKLRTKKLGVRQKPNVKDQIRIARGPVLEAELVNRNSEVAVVLTHSMRVLPIDVRTEFMHIEVVSISRVGYLATFRTGIQPDVFHKNVWRR